VPDATLSSSSIATGYPRAEALGEGAEVLAKARGCIARISQAFGYAMVFKQVPFHDPGRELWLLPGTYCWL
jgi:hypothetical protein